MTKQEKIDIIHKEMGDSTMRMNFNGVWVKIGVHPVMIGDVLDWSEGQAIYGPKFNQYQIPDFLYNLYLKWEKLRKPIEDQPDECIDFIYKLIDD